MWRNVSQNSKPKGISLVVVVSAMSGETNRLIGLAKEIQPHPDPASWMSFFPLASKSPSAC